MDFYIVHREPVGLLGVFFGLVFFRCNQVSVAFGFIFGTYIYSEFGCVGLDTILGMILELYFFRGILVSF
jgi:hypothetical protein